MFYKMKLLIVTIFSPLLLISCSYNPFVTNNHLSGSFGCAAIGAGVGAGTVALLGGTKEYIIPAGIIGGAIGYYISSLRYVSGGILQACGKVYKVGDYVGIYISSDRLFEPNSCDFIPDAKPILESAAAVLSRFPENQILVSGNTSSFFRAGWEQELSEQRAKKVAAVLWSYGIKTGRYVGYGDYFPIAKPFHNKGIRQNSRIQITSYPTSCNLYTPQKKSESIFDCLTNIIS